MLNISTLTRLENRALSEFRHKLLKKLSHQVVQIVLFGSKARGEQRKHSDIDFMVVLKKKDRQIEDLILDMEWEIFEKYGVYLSSLVYSLEEFNYYNELQTSFMLNVAKDGIKI